MLLWFQMATFNMIITCRCGNPTEHYCNTCGENLCSNCKETHLQDVNTRQHSVVKYTKKLMPGQASNPLCPYHNGQVYTKWCKTCKKAACIDCLISSHIGHSIFKLETILHDKRASLQKELENLESTDLKEWKTVTTDAEKTTTDFLRQVNGIEKELEDMAKKFHKKVDEILGNNKKQLKELTASSFTALFEQERRVSKGLDKVKQEIKECEDKLRSDDMESLLKHEREKNILPKISTKAPPVFTPGQIDTKSLTIMFGELTVPLTKGAKIHRYSSTDVSKETSKRQQVKRVPEAAQTKAEKDNEPSQASPGDARKSGNDNAVADKRVLQLISEPSVQSRFSAQYSYPLIACAGSDQTWVQADKRQLCLMDSRGC